MLSCLAASLLMAIGAGPAGAAAPAAGAVAPPVPASRPAEPEAVTVSAPRPDQRTLVQHVIRIELDPHVLPIRLDAIAPLLSTPAVAGATSLPPPGATVAASPNPPANAGPTPTAIQLDLAPAPSAPGDARPSPIVGLLRAAGAPQTDPALLEAAIQETLARLRTLLSDETRRVTAKLEERRAKARKSVEVQRQKADELLARRAAVLAQWNVRAISDSVPRLEADLRAADVEKARVTSELAGRRARQAKLSAELTRITQSVEKAAETDEASVALARVVTIRKETVARVHKMCLAGNASPNEQQQAETDLALAEADAARQRNLALQQARGMEVTQLRAMLTQVNMEIPDLEAQAQAAAERVKDLRAALAAIEEITTKVDRSIAAAEKELQSAEKTLTDLGAEIDGIRDADVTILGQN